MLHQHLTPELLLSINFSIYLNKHGGCFPVIYFLRFVWVEQEELLINRLINYISTCA